jgi:hypothetical protein
MMVVTVIPGPTTLRIEMQSDQELAREDAEDARIRDEAFKLGHHRLMATNDESFFCADCHKTCPEIVRRQLPCTPRTL